MIDSVSDAMLAPATETVRRPSSTADLILSRTESLLVHDARYSNCTGDTIHLSPSSGTHSAPLSASPSACWTGAAVPVTSGSKCSLSSTPSTSPEARKRYWCRQLMKLKEEMDRIGDGFRRSLRGIGTLRTRLSPATRRRWRNGDGSERLHGNGIDIEIIREVRRHRSKSADRSRNIARLEESSSSVDDTRRSYDYKLPSTLMVTGLRDGAFSGVIPLDLISSAQPITIRIRDYRLEVYVPGEDATTAERPTRLCFVGAVSLPIYVNPTSLMFNLSSSDVDAGVHQLLVDGRMKGCGTGVSDIKHRRLSVSANDLHLSTSSPCEPRKPNLLHF